MLDIMLQILEAGAGINVYECVLNLRSQRCFMVQTEVRYIIIPSAEYDIKPYTHLHAQHYLASSLSTIT